MIRNPKYLEVWPPALPRCSFCHHGVEDAYVTHHHLKFFLPDSSDLNNTDRSAGSPFKPLDLFC